MEPNGGAWNRALTRAAQGEPLPVAKASAYAPMREGEAYAPHSRAPRSSPAPRAEAPAPSASPWMRPAQSMQPIRPHLPPRAPSAAPSAAPSPLASVEISAELIPPIASVAPPPPMSRGSVRRARHGTPPVDAREPAEEDDAPAAPFAAASTAAPAPQDSAPLASELVSFADAAAPALLTEDDLAAFDDAPAEWSADDADEDGEEAVPSADMPEPVPVPTYDELTPRRPRRWGRALLFCGVAVIGALVALYFLRALNAG